MRKWAILADDFTGALDAGGQFASYGYDAAFTINPTQPADSNNVDVIIFSTNSREINPAVAEEKVKEAIHRIPPDYRIFKKIDSTFRGNIEREVLAVLESSSYQKAIICPAAPLQKRSVSGGGLYIDDIPISRSEFRNDPGYPIVTSQLSQFFIEKKPVLCDLKVVRQGVNTLMEYIIECDAELMICDAETEDDLLIIAQACCLNNAFLPCGAFGLAKAVCLVERDKTKQEETAKRDQRSCSSFGYALVLAGSVHPVTEKQLSLLKNQAQVAFFYVSPTDSIEMTGAEILTAVNTGIQTIVITQKSRIVDPRWMKISDMIAKIGAILSREKKPRTILFMGGQTTADFCDHFSPDTIFLKGEIEPGVPWGIMKYGGNKIKIISKAGAFGGDNLLLDVLGLI